MCIHMELLEFGSWFGLLTTAFCQFRPWKAGLMTWVVGTPGLSSQVLASVSTQAWQLWAFRGMKQQVGILYFK